MDPRAWGLRTQLPKEQGNNTHPEKPGAGGGGAGAALGPAQSLGVLSPSCPLRPAGASANSLLHSPRLPLQPRTTATFWKLPQSSTQSNPHTAAGLIHVKPPGLLFTLRKKAPLAWARLLLTALPSPLLSTWATNSPGKRRPPVWTPPKLPWPRRGPLAPRLTSSQVPAPCFSVLL